MSDLERAADKIEAEWYLAGPPKALPPKKAPTADLEPEKPPTPPPRRRH